MKTYQNNNIYSFWIFLSKICKATVKFFSWFYGIVYRYSSLRVTWYNTVLPSDTSLRPYHWNSAECDMIFKYNFYLNTTKWNLNEFRIIFHGTSWIEYFITMVSWVCISYPWDLNWIFIFFILCSSLCIFWRFQLLSKIH